MRLFIILSLLLLFISCSKQEIPKTNTLFNNTIMVLGHKGMGDFYKYLGNTKESIVPAIKIGSNGCEIDIQMTKDSVLVLFHNPELNGRTSCSGIINDLTFQELKECKYLAIENGLKIYTVDEIFSSIENLNQYYFSFDCKRYPSTINDGQYYWQFMRSIQRICTKYNMADNVILEGTDDWLVLATELNLSNRLFVSAPTPKEAVNLAIKRDYSGIGVGALITQEDVDYAHKNGKYVMKWQLKTTTENLEAIDLGIDIVQTDRPIHLLQRLHQYDYSYSIP